MSDKTRIRPDHVRRMYRRFEVPGSSAEDDRVVSECLGCKARWNGRVESDPARPGEPSLSFRHCPCCGTPFVGELRPSETTLRRHLLRDRAGARWNAPRIRYRVERWSAFGNRWEHASYWFTAAATGRREAIAAWRAQLREESIVAETYRLLAVIGRAEKTVLGPVTVPGTTGWRAYAPAGD